MDFINISRVGTYCDPKERDIPIFCQQVDLQLCAKIDWYIIYQLVIDYLSTEHLFKPHFYSSNHDHIGFTSLGKLRQTNYVCFCEFSTAAEIEI